MVTEEEPFKEINGHLFRYNQYQPPTYEIHVYGSEEFCIWCGWDIKFKDKKCHKTPSGGVKKTKKKKTEQFKIPDQVDMGELFNLE